MEINFLVMDNDSGYVSHNQESNLDSSSENNTLLMKSPTKSFCLNEDTLLENPHLVQREDSFDSVINTSQSSVDTTFSGLNDSSDLTDTLIPFVPPIIVIDKDNKYGEETSPMKATPFKTVPTCDNPRKRTENDDSNKENIDPTETPVKRYENRLNPDLSPDLFDDESSHVFAKEISPPVKTPSEKYVIKKDLKLLKNVQKGLCGVFPPPSVTFIQMSAAEMLQKFKDNESLFINLADTTRKESKSSLITATSSVCGFKPFPDVLEDRFHGLHHNRSKVSEEFEQLCVKYGERFVGSETQSTCTIFDSNLSPSKRKCPKPRWGNKSPGRRLSHLARRRITFSSANLQVANSSSILGSRTRQILVDAKKLSFLKKKSPRKSPRKTPSKSPFKLRRATPSSSAKKRAMRLRKPEVSELVPGTSSDSQSSQSFKRALFTSPPKDRTFLGPLAAAAEKKSTKRALFQSPSKGSPHKRSPFKLGLFDSRKRKRSESEENVVPKFPRSISMDVRPTSSYDSSSRSMMMNRTVSEANMSRFNSSARSEELSEVHKKKLQWAVYESLRLQNIGTTHPQFKTFATTLARVTRRFLPSSAAPRAEGRTSERMFRIARYHSYAVVQGKTIDEIVEEYNLKMRAKCQKPHGYVASDTRKSNSSLVSKESGVLQDKSNIINGESSEKSAAKPKSLNESRLDRIRKVISFERS